MQLQKHGAAPIAFADFREVVSDGARGMVQRAFNIEPGDTRFEPLRREFLALYETHLATHTQLFAGMADVLEFIEDNALCWGVVTNKPFAFAEPLLQKLDLRARCTTLICPDHVKQRKPDPESLFVACARVDCAVASAIYLGDHRRDIECARNAGMPAIACAYGYVHSDDPATGWNADFVVDAPLQIISLLQQLQLQTNG